MGVMIFLISSILGSIEIQIGMALGLFAIFAILRIRTVQYTVKDITYMFVVIGISVINSQANIPPPVLGAILINISVLMFTYLLELFLLKNNLEELTIIYNKPELLKPGLNKELLKDLSRLTGQNIEKVKIIKVNIKKKNAEIEVYFKTISIE
jgi:Ca2+/Na+ antiporter